MHQKLMQLTLSERRWVTDFLEEWQGLLDQVVITRLIFNDTQQVTMLLASLPDSWRSFVTTQGQLQNVRLSEIISRIQQEDNMRTSYDTPPTSTGNAYIDGAFYTNSQNRWRKGPSRQRSSVSSTFEPLKSRRNICSLFTYGA
eukprot:c17492_g1_i1 orf=32-460(-)